MKSGQAVDQGVVAVLGYPGFSVGLGEGVVLELLGLAVGLGLQAELGKSGQVVGLGGSDCACLALKLRLATVSSELGFMVQHTLLYEL